MKASINRSRTLSAISRVLFKAVKVTGAANLDPLNVEAEKLCLGHRGRDQSLPLAFRLGDCGGIHKVGQDRSSVTLALAAVSVCNSAKRARTFSFDFNREAFPRFCL